tara:strand:+ start:2706 stop:5426 length:2721 start_codon:yes stop_codon:yes gene_type:complete
MATLCYNIGEIGPAGGRIFALPFTGINQTKFYYEISLDDIEVPLTATLDNGDGVIPPVSVPALTTVGTEFGAYKQNVITSPAFGDGKKNTDILDALGVIPNSNPTIPARDLAATQCKQHGVTGPDGKDYADWFLPSKEEIEEAYNVIGAANLNLGGATVKPRWTSTGSLSSPFSATIAILRPNSLSFNPQADRSLPYGVRPIRRFVCKDKGLTYDHRVGIDFTSPGILNVGGQIVSPDPVTFQTSVDKVYIYQHQNMVMPPNSSLQQQNCIVLAFDSNNMTGNFPGTFPPWANNLPPQFASPSPAYLPIGTPQSQHATAGPLSFGPNLNTATGLGPIGFCWCPRLITYQAATHGPDDLPFDRIFDLSNGTTIGTPSNPATFSKLSALIGDNVDTLLFFYNGPPAGTLSPGSQFSLLPEFTGVDHNWDIEIIHPDYDPFEIAGTSKQIGLKTFYARINRYDVRGNNIRAMLESNFSDIQYKNFTIKIYDNFETLLGHWTYRYINDNPPNACLATQCAMFMAFKRVQTHFVLDPDPVNPNVVDAGKYQGKIMQSGAIGIGNAYMVIEMEDSTQNNTLWTGALTRGNTLNLVDWLGTGINQRVTDPNNLPSNWQSNVPNVGSRLSWGIICGPCGPYYATGSGICHNVLLKEYMAEVEYNTFIDNCKDFNGPFTVFYPYTGSIFGPLNQGYIDAQNAGCGGNNSARITGPSEEYESNVNTCFEDPLSAFILSEEEEDGGIDLHIGFEQHEQTARQKFANKTDIETGPFGVGGYYPLYDTKEAAAVNSPTFYASRDGENTYGYHIHKFGNIEYYMPNGLEMGVTQFHGDWDGTEIAEYSSTLKPLQTQQTQVVIQEEEQQEEAPQEQQSTVIITPQQTPPPTQQTPSPTPPTYTPPSSIGGGSSGGGGGGY